MSNLSMARIGRRNHVWNLLSLVGRKWSHDSIGDVRYSRAKVNAYRIELRGDGLATGRTIAKLVVKAALELGDIVVRTTERRIDKGNLYTAPYTITFEVE